MSINTRVQIMKRKKQSGVATLIFIIFIMLLTIVAVNNSFDFVRQEQLLSNNSGRARQSFEAAEAGMSASMSYLSGGGVAGGSVFSVNNTTSVGSGRVLVTTLPGANSLTQVISTGFSDDSTSTHFVTQFVDLVDPLPNDITNPLTSRSSVDITGSATIHNPEGHTTIWSGGTADLGANNSTATQIPDVNNIGTNPGDYPQCMDVSFLCQLVDSSSKVSTGLDVIDNDATLASMTNGELFEQMFGIDPDQYYATSSQLVTRYSSGATGDADVQLATSEVIWIEEPGGTVSFSGNTTVGCAAPANGNVSLGNINCAPANLLPSITIIRAPLVEFQGNSTFYGLLYIIGDVEVRGNMNVVGAMVVDGVLTSDTGGSLDIWFNSDVLSQTDLAGAFSAVSGTWRDFD